MGCFHRQAKVWFFVRRFRRFFIVDPGKLFRKCPPRPRPAGLGRPGCHVTDQLSVDQFTPGNEVAEAKLRHQIARLEAENAALQKTSTGTLSPVAVSAIGQWLADAMAVAVDNGASSVSMPDEFIEIAAWLASMDGLAVADQAPVEHEAELAGLRRFAGKVLLSAREHMGDVDGGDIQGWAVESGLLKEVQATEPCGEHCECASVGDFPLACFLYTGAGLSALEVAKESP